MNEKSIITDLETIMEYASYEDVENLLEIQGYKVISPLETDEEIGSFSTDVDWDGKIIVEKDYKQFNIILSGTAIGEISYDRWVDSYGYDIDDFNVCQTK